MKKESQFPLKFLKSGEKAIIEYIDGEKIKVQFQNLGLKVGDEIEILSGSMVGPIIVKRGDTKIGIGGGMSHKVFVKMIEEESCKKQCECPKVEGKAKRGFFQRNRNHLKHHEGKRHHNPNL